MIYMLELLQVQKSYGVSTILAPSSLQLDNGICWVQGPNGSGKTTLLRMVAGLTPFKGDIRLDGCSLRKAPFFYRRLVSWSDAEPLYPDFLSGQDLVAFYREARLASTAQVADLVALFRMQSYLSTRIGSWSSGMTKKLSLLLAFLGNPSLIILDEPLVTLDADCIPVLYELIGTYRRGGTGFLLSSHQPLDSSSLSVDRKIKIDNQAILQIP
jgi:ABC-2 type transport system ATP-binding protein